eukprot:Polyplicarium_translucidae@DN3312_c0_g1_i7.p1
MPAWCRLFLLCCAAFASALPLGSIQTPPRPMTSQAVYNRHVRPRRNLEKNLTGHKNAEIRHPKPEKKHGGRLAIQPSRCHSYFRISIREDSAGILEVQPCADAQESVANTVVSVPNVFSVCLGLSRGTERTKHGVNMARGLRKHLKRVHTPSHWCLDKLSGVYAPRPSSGPHKIRECLPLTVLLRNRLKYALTGNEVKLICMQRLVEVDGKVRTDTNFPCGMMDVLSIPKTSQHFRLLIDTKGRFVPQRISPEEATYKLCRVKFTKLGDHSIPQCVTHDGRTIRFITPEVKANDTVRVDLKTGKILDHVKFERGKLAMITGGRSAGRVGVITHREKHVGSFEVVHLKDGRGQEFVTRLANVFVIGTPEAPQVTLLKDKGIKVSIIEDRNRRLVAV